MKYLRPDLVAIRGWFGSVHLLLDSGKAALVDTGFVGDAQRVRRCLNRCGLGDHDLLAILLTHGHLDHTSNASAIHTWSGAEVYAPTGDEQLVGGTHTYHGLARVCGVLEWAGRLLCRYQPPTVRHWLRDGDELPFWGGLRVVGLPGHTPGHVGFYSMAKRTFLVGDTFAAMLRVALPPRILSTNTQQARYSFVKALAQDADLYIPTHYFALGSHVQRRIRAKAAAVNLRSEHRPSTFPT